VTTIGADRPESRWPRTLLSTCCVPWAADGSLCEDAFRANIRRQADAGLQDLYIFGTAGEGYAVDDRQFDAVARAFVAECVAAGARPMVGIISSALTTVVGRIERAAALGVRAFQISLPSWGALSDVELGAFFDAVCGRFPELRFLHYNLPRAQRLVRAPEYVALAARHPNLVATKVAVPDLALVASLLSEAAVLRHFLTESAFVFGSLVGRPGLLVAISSVNPRLARRLFDAGTSGDLATLTTLHADLLALRAVVREVVGASAHMDGAFDKVYCRLRDDRFPLRLLPPYQGVTEEAFVTIKSRLRRRFPHWLER
jgi:dihydrodipicolinate synthase/N-acetylneuraminate lyase